MYPHHRFLYLMPKQLGKKPGKNLLAAASGLLVIVLLTGGYGIYSIFREQNQRLDREAQARASAEARFLAETIAREQQLKRLEAERSAAPAKFPLVIRRAPRERMVASSQQAQASLPPLTESEVHQCAIDAISILRFKSADAGGFQFEGDRDRAVDLARQEQQELGCNATPQRFEQVRNRFNIYIQSSLYR